jgi:hypothetical protein
MLDEKSTTIEQEEEMDQMTELSVSMIREN